MFVIPVLILNVFPIQFPMRLYGICSWGQGSKCVYMRVSQETNGMYKSETLKTRKLAQVSTNTNPYMLFSEQQSKTGFRVG